MVVSTNPLAPIHWVLFVATLVTAYGIGGLLRFRTTDPLTNIGLRLCLGLTAIICWIATARTMGNTLLLPLSIFLLASIQFSQAKLMFEDLKALGASGLLLLIVTAVSVFMLEAWRSDLRQGNMLLVGFPDIASYSALGNGFFQSGCEGLATNVGTILENQAVLYHVGDLWHSAIYSHFLHILPQYAYTVLARGTTLFAIMVLIFALIKGLSSSSLLSLIGVFFSLFGVDTILVYINHPEISLLRTFVFSWPLYASGPYANVALAALPLISVSFTSRSLWPLIGLVISPCLNPGLMLSFVAGAVFLLGAKSILSLIKKNWHDLVPFRFAELGYLFFAATIPFVFATISGHSQGGSPPITEPAYIYLIIHTVFRTLLSAIYFIPALIGLFFLMRDKNLARGAWLVGAGYLGTIAAFSAAYPWIQGNTIQMLALYSSALIIPCGMLGLSVGWNSRGIMKYVSVGAIVALFFSSGKTLVATHAFASTYKSTSSAGIQNLTKEEYDALLAIGNNGFVKIGFYVDSNTEYPVTRPHFTEFTGLKGLINRIEFYRLNELPSDTSSALEMRQWYNKSIVAHYNQQFPGQPEQALKALMTDLDPQVLITLVGSDVYTIPVNYSSVYSKTDTVGRFIFHSRP